MHSEPVDHDVEADATIRGPSRDLLAMLLGRPLSSPWKPSLTTPSAPFDEPFPARSLGPEVVTMGQLRYVDPTAPRSRLTPLMARLGTNRVANAISRTVSWKLDPLLLRISGGRVATTLVIPSAVLETRGARTGQLRRNAVIYFNDGPDRVVIAASHAGRPHHPSWYHNLRANPDVTIGGIAARASVVEDAGEQQRLWALADNVFPAFADYRRSVREANRTIPLVALALSAPAG